MKLESLLPRPALRAARRSFEGAQHTYRWQPFRFSYAGRLSIGDTGVELIVSQMSAGLLPKQRLFLDVRLGDEELLSGTRDTDAIVDPELRLLVETALAELADEIERVSAWILIEDAERQRRVDAA